MFKALIEQLKTMEKLQVADFQRYTTAMKKSNSADTKTLIYILRSRGMAMVKFRAYILNI